MAKVWFQNSEHLERVIAEVNDWNEAWKAIHQFLADHHYTSHYQRIWKAEDGRTQVDVGSWSEFFFVNLPTKEITYDN
jgi:hypothetical protein